PMLAKVYSFEYVGLHTPHGQCHQKSSWMGKVQSFSNRCTALACIDPVLHFFASTRRSMAITRFPWAGREIHWGQTFFHSAIRLYTNPHHVPALPTTGPLHHAHRIY